MIATIDPSGASYVIYSTPAFTVAAGPHTIEFLGLNPNGGDNTAFIDAVSLANVSAASSVLAGGSTTTIAAASGVATFSGLSLDTPGLYFLTATAPGLTSEVSTGFTNIPAAASQLAVTNPPATITAGQPVGSLQVSLEDPSGNVATGTIATITIGTTLIAPISDSGFETPSEGSGGFQYDPSGSPWTFSATNNVPPSPSGAGISANGSGFTSGNPTAPEGSQVAFIQGTGSISQSVNFAAGAYFLSFAAAQRGNQPSAQSIQILVDSQVIATIDPSGTSYTNYTTPAFNVAAGPHTIEFLGLNPNGEDNTALIDQVAVTGTSANNGAVSSVSTTSVPAVNGVASFTNLTLNTAGTYSLTALTNGLTPVITSDITVNPAAPAQLVFTQIPGPSTAGQTLSSSVMVSIEDAYGNLVTSGTPMVTLSLSGPGNLAAGSTSSVAAQNGVATFSNLVLDTAGSYTLQASSGVLTSNASSSFTVTAAGASQLQFGQAPGTTMAGQVMSPSIQVDVEDRYHNLVTTSTAPLSLTANGPAGFATGTPTVNASGGIATFSNLMLGTAGSYTLTAADTNSSDGLTSATTQPFAVHAALSASLTNAGTALQNISTGAFALASFNEVGAASSPSNYTATVNWGDNTTSSSTGSNPAVTISIAGGMVTVSGSHTFTTAGMAYPTVTLTYQGVSVSTPSQAITIDVAADVTGQIKASESAYHGNPFTKVTTTTLTLANSGSSSLPGQFSVVLHGLASTVALQSATIAVAGTTTPLALRATSAGEPVILIPLSLLSTLGGNQAMQIGLSFSNPSNGSITFTPKLFSEPAVSGTNQGTTTVPHTGNSLTAGPAQFTFAQASSTLTSFALGGVTFTSTNLQVSYSPPAGGSTGGTYVVYGTATMSGVAGLSNITVQLGTDAASPGLVIANNSLQSFAATISGAGFTVPGGSLAPSGSLQLSYSTTGETFTLSGGATLSAGSLTLTIDLGGASTAGLLIEDGSLDQINASLTGSFTVSGLTFTTTGLTIGYSSASNGTYTVSGDTTLTDGSLTDGPLLDIDLGGNGTAGLVITNGALTSLDASMSGSFTIAGVSIDASGLTVSYSPDDNGTYTISGATKISGPNIPTIAIQLGYTDGSQTVPGLQIEDGTLVGFDASVSSTSSFNLGGMTIAPESLTVAYTSDNGGTYSISGDASLSVPNVIDISIQLGGTENGQTIPGLQIEDGTLEAFDASVTSSFNVGGVTIQTTGLTVAYTSDNGGTYTVSGGASLSVSSDTSVAIQLGSTEGTQTVPGLQIENGTLEGFDASVTSSFKVGGLTIQTNGLTVQYTASTDTYDISGGASLSLSDTTNIAVNVGGIEVVNGTLENFNASVTSSFVLGGLTIQTNGLGVDYTASTDTYDISGGASLSVSDTTNIAINVTDIQVVNGSLTIFDASVTSSFQVGGLTIQTTGLDVDYTASTDTYDISGTASLSIPDGSNISIQLGDSTANPAVPGLEIVNGTLEGFDASVTANFNMLGLSVAVTDLTVVYAAPTTSDPHSLFEVYGSFTVSTATKSLNGLGATLGDSSDPGLVFQDGNLQSLNIGITGSIAVGPTSLTFNDLTVSYVVSSGVLQITGGATLDLSPTISGGINLPDGGLTINTSTGAIEVNGLEVTLSATFGSFGVNDLDVIYTDAAGVITVAASGTVDLPDNIAVGGSFVFSGGSLTEIGLSYNQTPGIPVGTSGLYITSLSGQLNNLNDPSAIVVTASIGVTYGQTVQWGGQDYSLFTATGAITVSASELDITGNAKLVGGYLGTGTADLDLNWSTNTYSMMFNCQELGGLESFGGSLTFSDSSAGFQVAGSADFLWGQIPGTSDAVIDVHGTLAIDSSELTLDGTESLAGGTLGSGTGSLTLNWAQGIYSIAFDDKIGSGGADLEELSGSLTIDNSGDVSGTATYTLGAVGSFSLVQVTSSLVINSQGLTLTGSGTMANGILGSSNLDISLDWADGNYQISFDTTLLGGLGTLDGNMSVNTQTGTASGSAELTLGAVSSSFSAVDLSGVFNYNSQGLTLDGTGSLWGISLGTIDVNLNFSTNTYSIASTYSDDGFDVTANFTVLAGSNWSFGGQATFDFEIDTEVGPISVAGVNLGSVHLDAGFTGTVSVDASAGESSSSFELGLGGSFSFEGASLTLPTFTLSATVHPGSIAALAQSIVGEIESDASSIFSGLGSDITAWISDIKSGIITGVSDIGNALVNVYHVVAADVLGWVQDANQGLATAASILSNDYHQAASVVASTLQSGGVVVADIASALETGLAQTPAEIVSTLNSAGYAIADVAAALQSGLNQSAREAAQILNEAALYTLSEVGDVLQSVYDIVDPATLQNILGAAGYALSEINSYFSDLGGDFDSFLNSIASGFNPSSW